MSVDLGTVALLAVAGGGLVMLGSAGHGRSGARGPGPRTGPGGMSPNGWRTGPGRAAAATASGPGTLGGLAESLVGRRRRTATAARWAGAHDLAPLSVPAGAPTPGRLVLGRAERRRPPRAATSLVAEAGQSVAVIGPTQSGKTTSLAVPAILGWEGPVVAASVKTDLLAATIDWRATQGRVWCFDPAGSTGVPADPWSPLQAAVTWPGARRVAAALTELSRSDTVGPDSDFWYANASKLLSALLFAAASGHRDLHDVVRWLDTQEMVEPARLLDTAGVPAAVHAAQASWGREERLRSNVYTTAETVLEAFAEPTSPVAVTSARTRPSAGPIDPAALVAGPHTLYLCAPAHDQRRLRGLFTALVKEVLESAFEQAARQGKLDPPLLVVLDEAANIAPLAELDGLAATCAGHGIQLVTVWQDLAQVNARYGARAATVVNNHRAKVFLPGIADPGTLDHASHLVGEEELQLPSVTFDPTGARSTTTSTARRSLLPPDALRRLAPGTAVCLYGALPPFRLRLMPWWENSVLAGRGRRSRP